MIRYIKGELAAIGTDHAIIDVGGIGYRIYISAMTLSALPRIGGTIQLFTYLQVREDAMALFGFSSMEELELFEQLIGVSSVGPKAALAILGVLSANDLKFAILAEDAKAISRAPGVGAKTAQRIVMELKEKVSLEDAFEQRITAPDASMQQGAVNDAILGLVALGYGSAEATRAVRSVPDAQELDAEGLIKQALKQLF